jgi:multidrug efflux pump subunit AcrB
MTARLSEQQLYDLGATMLRVPLATVQGASVPQPYGGKQPQVQVALDPAALQANGLSPLAVVNAIGAQNLILPAGTAPRGPCSSASVLSSGMWSGPAASSSDLQGCAGNG